MPRPFVRHLVGRTVVVEVAPHAATPHARLDANQLDQVLLNLAANARDAMPDGGTLRIETFDVTGPVPGTQVPAGEYVALSVSDSGAGIPAEIRAQIFDPFFTTKPKGKGTGLGLSTAYGIVTQFGGFMDVTSRAGHGTTFVCYFPVAQPAADAVDVRPATSTPATGSETVLVVEDEPIGRRGPAPPPGPGARAPAPRP